MIYRRYPGIRRRYINPGAFTYQNGNENDNLLTKDIGHETSISDIPLPNQTETEKKEPAPGEQKKAGIRPFIDMLKNKLHIEDLLLLALIFLLFDEGVEDDFLLLMLLFIFLS